MWHPCTKTRRFQPIADESQEPKQIACREREFFKGLDLALEESESIFFSLPGDIRRDSKVDFQDLVILSSAYKATTIGGPAWSLGVPVDNGFVGFQDLINLSMYYGKQIQQIISSKNLNQSILKVASLALVLLAAPVSAEAELVSQPPEFVDPDSFRVRVEVALGLVTGFSIRGSAIDPNPPDTLLMTATGVFPFMDFSAASGNPALFELAVTESSFLTSQHTT